MRQIAEFVAVLACALFAGAAVYVSLVEHPARLECGVSTGSDRVPSELSSGHHHAGDVGSLGFAIIDSRLARRGDILVARWRCAAGLCYPIHADRDPADQQAVVEPCTGQAVGRHRAAACTLGQVARS